MRRLSAFLLGIALLAASAAPLRAQLVISLSGVIGPAGTNAATVDGVGLAVNTTGVALSSGATVLVAASSPAPVSFDFGTGFPDSLSRSIGSTAGAGNVFVDLKYDSSTTGPLVLDLNGDGAFGDESPVAGFGLHSDTFITFDLAVIRSNAALAADMPFTLTGIAGLANPGAILPTSAAILADGGLLAVYDWTAGAGTMTSSFNLTLAGSARYLTFAGLSGTDFDNFYAHVGFASVQLTAVPEPASALLVALGLALLPVLRRSRSAS